jgi:hypothetical protein
MEIKKVETNTATIFIDENEIIHVVLYEGIVMDYYDAMDHYLVIKDLNGNKPVLKLIDSRCNWTIQRRAQEFLSGKEVKEKTIARAVVLNSSIKTALMNFFNDLNKPEVPTKNFTDYDKAYQWLMEMRDQKKADLE